MANPRYLVRSDNGRIFTYTPALAKLPSMIESMDLEEAQMLSRKRGGQPTPVNRGPDPGQGDDEPFVISTANKDDLEAFAKEQFDVDLDKRKSVKDLRNEVMELTKAIEGQGE